jgi:hypothetical protein
MKRSAPLTRKVPLKRNKPLRGGRSTGTPTRAEADRIREAKFGRCIPCLVWARLGHMPAQDVAETGDYDHKKSGNVRRGHAFGYCACKWHHQRHPGEGWTHAQMRAHFGPSLLDGSRLFHDTYGSDDDLIALQTEELSR